MDWSHIAGYMIPGYGAYSMGKDLWNWGKGHDGAPQMPQNPYKGQWDSLITQLDRQANDPNAPSLAGDAYKQAQQTGMDNVLSMSRGGSAGAARMGMQTLGRMNQGLAQGYSNARLQEQLAARQQLQGALQGASNSWYQPQYANLMAQVQTPSNLQTLTGVLSQLFAAGGTMAGGKGQGQGQG